MYLFNTKFDDEDHKRMGLIQKLRLPEQCLDPNLVDSDVMNETKVS